MNFFRNIKQFHLRRGGMFQLPREYLSHKQTSNREIAKDSLKHAKTTLNKQHEKVVADDHLYKIVADYLARREEVTAEVIDEKMAHLRENAREVDTESK